jgi:hypothetical protein
MRRTALPWKQHCGLRILFLIWARGLTENQRSQHHPPKTLFNHKDGQSIKTVHHCHKQAATTAGSTPPWKGKGKVVNIASSDEESASSSSQDRPRTAASIGDKDFPTASDEGNGKAPGVVDGG